MLHKIALTIIASLTVIGCVSTTPTSNNRLPVRNDLQHYQLENGLQVYLLQRNQPGVELRLLVGSGSLQENEQQLYFAHFTEHIL